MTLRPIQRYSHWPPLCDEEFCIERAIGMWADEENHGIDLCERHANIMGAPPFPDGIMYVPTMAKEW